VDERGALLGVGGCVDTRGLAADSAPDTSEPELVHSSLSAPEGGGSDSPVALGPAGPADFREQCGDGLVTTDYRASLGRRCGLWLAESQCPCVLQLNVGSSPLPLATTVGCDQVGGKRARAAGVRSAMMWRMSARCQLDLPSCLLAVSTRSCSAQADSAVCSKA
jgi:hypothetical protein